MRRAVQGAKWQHSLPCHQGEHQLVWCAWEQDTACETLHGASASRYGRSPHGLLGITQHGWQPVVLIYYVSVMLALIGHMENAVRCTPDERSECVIEVRV